MTTALLIARRDLLLVARNRSVLIPLIMLPVVFVVVLPLGVTGVSRIGSVSDSFSGLLGLAARRFPALGAAHDGVSLAVAIATYLVPVLLMIVPLLAASVIAADSIAGERERDTIEALSLTPATEREILVGKALGPYVVALVMGAVSQVLVAAAISALMWSSLDGRLLLPSWDWAVIVFFLSPAFAAAVLGLTVVVSARAATVQGANQIAGLAVIPIVGGVIGQAVGLIGLQVGTTLVIGSVLWVVAAALIAVAQRVVVREKLITR